MTDFKNPSGSLDQDPVDLKKEEKSSVAYESYMKALGEKKAAQERLKEMEARLSDFENAQREAEERKLNEKGEFKKIVELREAEIAKLKDELNSVAKERDSYRGNLTDTYKLQSFYDKLPGKIKRQEFLNFVDLDSIVLDPETGSVDSQSVDNVVSSFMENYGDLVETNKFGGLPGDAPRGKKSLTVKEWQKLPLNEKKQRMGEVDFSKD